MKHLVSPMAGVDIVPITQPVHVEGGQLQGTAIAMQYTGSDGLMYYLVAADNAQTPPVWVAEKDLSLAYIGVPRADLPDRR